MRMKLFRYGYLIRHAFDLGRIFPIIFKQRGVIRIYAGITSQIIDAPILFWNYLLNLDNQIQGSLLIWLRELGLFSTALMKFESLIQLITW